MDIDKEIAEIQVFIDRGNFHAAMNLTISAMNECRRDDNQAGIDRFLAHIQFIADTMQQAFGSQ